MNTQNEKVDAHIWAERKKGIKIVALVLLFGVLPASWAIYNHFSPIVDTQYLQGTLESMHQSQSLVGSDFNHFFVRLKDNELVKVAVSKDRGIPYRERSEVEIKMIVRQSGKTVYSFERYIN